MSPIWQPHLRQGRVHAIGVCGDALRPLGRQPLAPGKEHLAAPLRARGPPVQQPICRPAERARKKPALVEQNQAGVTHSMNTNDICKSCWPQTCLLALFFVT